MVTRSGERLHTVSHWGSLIVSIPKLQYYWNYCKCVETICSLSVFNKTAESGCREMRLSRWSIDGQGSLRIDNVSEGDAGQYTCRALASNATIETHSTVRILGKKLLAYPIPCFIYFSHFYNISAFNQMSKFLHARVTIGLAIIIIIFVYCIQWETTLEHRFL